MNPNKEGVREHTDDGRIDSFIASYLPEQDEFIKSLEKKAIDTGVPIIRRDTVQLLKLILYAKQPGKILEIGTAIGFSAILMAKYTPGSTYIVTVEDYAPRVKLARENIEASGFKDRIKLIEGDGAKILSELDEVYDLIFIDAAKAQYPVYFNESKRLLKGAGILIADNCLKGGEIAESKFAVTRRNRTIHKRMREFLLEVSRSEDFVTTILPIGDGVVLAVKRSD